MVHRQIQDHTDPTVMAHFSREAQSGYAQVNGADWYYEARFWDGMPDLDLQNEEVRREFEFVCAALFSPA